MVGLYEKVSNISKKNYPTAERGSKNKYIITVTKCLGLKT